jgi:hypothetical protein
MQLLLAQLRGEASQALPVGVGTELVVRRSCGRRADPAPPAAQGARAEAR